MAPWHCLSVPLWSGVRTVRGVKGVSWDVVEMAGRFEGEL